MTHLSKQTTIDLLQRADAHVYAREFPVHEITLRFRSEADKEEFMGQLSDGWGENVCQLFWSDDKTFDETKVFDIELLSDDYGDDEENDEEE
jgi:hypothetical protein